MVNFLTTVGHSLHVLFRLWMFLGAIFPLLLGTSTGNVSQSFFGAINFCGFMTLITPTQWAFNGQGSQGQCSSSWLKTAQYQKRYPSKGKEVVSTLICTNKVRLHGQFRPRPSIYSQSSLHVHGRSWICQPTSPYLTFFTSAKTTFKWIAPTDNVHPNSDNAKWCHRWLKVKGLISICSGLEPWLLQGH